VKPRPGYSLARLAELARVPPRTVRYYIARGLLKGPEKAGRDAAYGDAHLKQLERIRALQSAGRTLAEIARELEVGRRRAPVTAPTPWWRHAVADDVVVMVKAEGSPWRLKQVRDALEEFAARLR
jgi:DNA-binding transcriptional MerR regulator